MALVVNRTGAADYGRYIKALICGNPGSGKTLISSTFPDPFYASAESGLMSIADRNLPFTVIRASEELNELLRYMRLDPAVREEKLGVPVQTVVIDTIDEIQDILINERLKSEKTDTMRMQDWGWLGDQMKAIVSGFRNLDMNVVFTCHIKQVTESETGKVWYLPALKGAIDEKIAGMVDLSLMLQYTSETKIIEGRTQKIRSRQLISEPFRQYEFLKDRSGKLPSSADVNFEDDYQRMHDVIYSKVTELVATQAIVVDELPAPRSLEDEVEAPKPSAKELIARRKAEAAQEAVKATESAPKATEPASADLAPETPQPARRKPATQLAGGIPEEPQHEVKSADGGTLMSRNELPDGILAKRGPWPDDDKKHTNIYCVMTGDEIDSELQADMSRIRHRKILSESAMKALKR